MVHSVKLLRIAKLILPTFKSETQTVKSIMKVIKATVSSSIMDELSPRMHLLQSSFFLPALFLLGFLLPTKFSTTSFSTFCNAGMFKQI